MAGVGRLARQDAGILLLSHAQGDPEFSVTGRSLRGGLQGGMEIVEVDNGRMKFWLLPERGMGIWKVWLDGIEIGWQSPVLGPVHPQFVPLHEESGLGWLAGFDELLCRCGLESNGAAEFDAQGKLKYPLHGKIANLPAHSVEAAMLNDAIQVTGCVEEARFKGTRLQLLTSVTTGSNETEIILHDTVTNLSGTPGEFQLLYHINFAAPFLEAGAQVFAPLKTLVPRTLRAEQGIKDWANFSAPESGFEEQVFFMELLGDATGRTQVLLKNAAGNLAVSVHFNLEQLPCFTLWKNTASLLDGYVTGLEPGTNYPNPRSFEQAQGRTVKLLPGESRNFDVRIEFHTDAASVSAAQQKIKQLQATGVALIHAAMQPGWTCEAISPALPSSVMFRAIHADL